MRYWLTFWCPKSLKYLQKSIINILNICNNISYGSIKWKTTVSLIKFAPSTVIYICLFACHNKQITRITFNLFFLTSINQNGNIGSRTDGSLQRYLNVLKNILPNSFLIAVLSPYALSGIDIIISKNNVLDGINTIISVHSHQMRAFEYVFYNYQWLLHLYLLNTK